MAVVKSSQTRLTVFKKEAPASAVLLDSEVEEEFMKTGTIFFSAVVSR
jgi:hypothetical protein